MRRPTPQSIDSECRDDATTAVRVRARATGRREVGTALEQLDGRFDVAVARRAHQRRVAVGVLGVDVLLAQTRQQRRDDARVAEARGPVACAAGWGWQRDSSRLEGGARGGARGGAQGGLAEGSAQLARRRRGVVAQWGDGMGAAAAPLARAHSISAVDWC
eukprot:7298166-Prymnesium_polylepis.1